MHKTFSTVVLLFLIYLQPLNLWATFKHLQVIKEEDEDAQTSSESSEVIVSFPFKSPQNDMKDYPPANRRKSDTTTTSFSLSDLITSVADEVKNDFSRNTSLNRLITSTAASREISSASTPSGVHKTAPSTPPNLNNSSDLEILETASSSRGMLDVRPKKSPTFYKKRLFPQAPLTGELSNANVLPIPVDNAPPKVAPIPKIKTPPGIFPYAADRAQQNPKKPLNKDPSNYRFPEDQDSLDRQAIEEESASSRSAALPRKKPHRFSKLKEKISSYKHQKRQNK